MAVAAGAVVVAVVGTTGVGALLDRTRSPVPVEFSWTMWGPVASTGDPATPVSYPASISGAIQRVQVTYTEGGRFTVDAGPESSDHIEITDFAFGGAPVVHLESVSTSPMLSRRPILSPMRPFDPKDAARARNVHFTFAFDSCRGHEPGSRIALESVDVTYRAKGRTAQQTVPLPNPIDVVFPAGCG
jgi:hypothetical protein